VGEPAWIIGLVVFTTFVDLHYGNGEIWFFCDHVGVCFVHINSLAFGYRVACVVNGMEILLSGISLSHKYLIWVSPKVQLIDHAVRHQLPRRHYCPAPAQAVQRALLQSLSAKKRSHTGPTN
jgi:hypothetical protein